MSYEYEPHTHIFWCDFSLLTNANGKGAERSLWFDNKLILNMYMQVKKASLYLLLYIV